MPAVRFFSVATVGNIKCMELSHKAISIQQSVILNKTRLFSTIVHVLRLANLAIIENSKTITNLTKTQS